MRFSLHVALSHLGSRRKEAGISAFTLISVVGVTIGVAALVVVLSVMAGFEVDLRDKILGSNAHVVVLRYGGPIEDAQAVLDSVEAVPGVEGAAPFVYTEMMIRSSAGASGVVMKGVDPARVGKVLDLVDDVILGPDGAADTALKRQAAVDALEAHAQPGADAVPGILIGEELAQDLRVSVGDTLHVINPVGDGMPGPMGTPVPDVRTFRVVGVFYSGMYEYDTKWTYVGLSSAQDFLDMGQGVTGVELTVDDIYAVDDIGLRVESALGYPYYARNWKELNSSLFHALKLEKVVMGLILSLIVGVAALNIVGTLIMVVLSKGREIAILKAMGASSDQVRTVFMLEGAIIGAVGSGVGTVLGLLGCWALREYGWPLDTDVYYLDSLPVVIEPHMVALVALGGIAICFAATLYPASRAASLDPVEGLRYE